MRPGIRFALLFCLFASLVPSARADTPSRFPALAGVADAQDKAASTRSERIETVIERVKASGQGFKAEAPFVASQRTGFAWPETRAELKDGLVLSVDFAKVRTLLAENPNNVVFKIPGLDGGTVQLEMTRVNFLSPDFRVVGSNSPDRPTEVQQGLHYWGVVQGMPGSLAAVSVFEGEMMGIFRTKNSGTVVLGRLKGENPRGDHVLYAEKDLIARNPFTCETKDGRADLGRALFGESPTVANEIAIGAAGQSIRVYFEADYDIYQANGQKSKEVSNFVTGLFSQSAILYQNESVPLTLSEIFVWETSSPYAGLNDANSLLNAFQAQFQPQGTRPPFNGDLGHLLTFRGNAGLAAGFSGLCNADRRQSQCFSGVFSTYSAVPQYSWSVEVVTHEMGHLIGSRHTHACVWNGNNTAIDGCAGYTEEGCPLPPNPPAGVGGTIMSYCHQISVGINFNNGFGPQPGAVLRDRFANAGCLNPTIPLSIGQQPVGRIARIGSSTSFSVTAANGTTPYAYRWQSSAGAGGPFADLNNGGAFSGVTTATLTINPVAVSQAGYYRCRVTDASSPSQQAISNAAQLTALTALAVTQHPGNATAPVGGSASFSVAATGAAPLAYQWQSGASASGPWNNVANGGGISGATSATLAINPVAAAHAGYYRCRVSDAGPAPNQVFSNAGLLTVNTTPPAPSGLVAWFDLQSRTIRLNWIDNSSNEQGFRVQFSYSGSAFSDMSPPTVGPNVTNYTSGANPPIGSYQFRVGSYLGASTPLWSNTASLIVPSVVAGYQGCYTDAATRALPFQLGGTTQTIASCKQAALNAGYLYAGLQYYGYCFAGNSLAYSLVSDRECNTPCTSDPSQMCGGAWRNSIYSTGYTPSASASIAWIQPAESSWGPAGTLTAAGYAANGTGTVQLVFRERSDNGVWGSWQTVAYTAPVSGDTTWSNTISSGNPTNKCHWFDAYVNYSGVTSSVFHYTGWTGCP